MTKYFSRLLSMLAAFVVTCSFANAETIVPTLPETEPTFDDFEVWVDGQQTPVWQCRVSAIPFNRIWPGYQRGQDQSELAGFATWQTNANANEVVVKTARDAAALQSVVVRPQSLGIVPKVDVDKKEITFTIPDGKSVVLEVGGFHGALHLFPSPIYARPEKLDAPNLRYFAPGVHKVGVIEVKSGDEIFVDAGAIVYGGVRGTNVENIKVWGPGIIDAGPYERGEIGGIFGFRNCKNITIDGVIQRDTDVWATTLARCDDVTIRNTKLIGFWRYNADGIDVCNSENVLVENSFLRTFDDGLVVKGIDQGVDGPQKPSKNLTFRNNTIWCDWGRAMELGAETRAPEFANIKFENSDIIRTTHIAMDIQHGDRAKIHDVIFDNIRVEMDDKIPTPIYQNSDDHVYDPNADPNYCPALAVIVIQSTFYSGDKVNGTVDDVLFKDVRVLGSRKPAISLTGLDAEHQAKNVVFENLQYGDQTIDSPEKVELRTNEFVQGVEFRSAK